MDNQELHFDTTADANALSGDEQWLVTLSAPLSAFNGDYVNAVLTGKDNDVLREGIADVWSELAARSGKSTQELAALMMGSPSWVEALRKHFHVSQAEVPSLVAWDAVRLASLSRWAVQLGYIERAEFAGFAGGLARQVREAYSSWSQVSAAYIAGGLIWKYSDAREEHLLRTNRMLLNEARSPYRSVPFAG
jgi:hypothetical protein